MQDQYGVLSSALQEDIAGIRVVQAYAQEPFEEKHFEGLSRTYMKLGFRLIRYRALFFASMGSLVGLLMLVLLWAGGMRVIIRSDRTWRVRRLPGVPGDADLALHRPRLGPLSGPAGRGRDGANDRDPEPAAGDRDSPASPVEQPAKSGGRSASAASGSVSLRTPRRSCAESTSRSRRDRPWRSWGGPEAARRRWSRSSRGFSTPPRGRF